MPVSDKERKVVLSYCNKYLEGTWQTASEDEIQIDEVRGGMTNQLYRCSLNQCLKINLNEPRQVLLRIYGPSKEEIETDLEIFNQLALAGLGPKLHAAFGHGRFEEYLPSKALRWIDMTNDAIATVMARKIAAIHRLDVNALDKKSNWLIDKYRQFEEFIDASKSTKLIFSDFVPESSQIKAKKLMNIDFKHEIAFLEDLFLKTQKSPLVFSHNDLHQNNVIILHDENLSLDDRVVLIDFEYSSYNFRTFDTANHLCEWCFDYDNESYPYFHFSLDRFPSFDVQKRFLSNYIERLVAENGKTNIFLNNGHSDHSQEEMVDVLFCEMQACLMASNLLWAMWAIQSALTSKIKFGYWDMAQGKWDCYILTKKQFADQVSTRPNRA